MATRMASRLEEYFTARVGENLRSIVTYEEDSFELEYLRDDVGDRYTDIEIDKAIDESRMESLSAPIYDGLYDEDHGDLTCMVKCYEHVIEMNFVLNDGVGAAVALDAEALSEAAGLVGEARQIVIDERNGT
jgi:hypothetical protein